ncbi:hypothetical protein TRVL_03844 [Trypanosoma vivax]|nr:hypothetical protein TRVL_03844 [Trypanosoma vivax]
MFAPFPLAVPLRALCACGRLVLSCSVPASFLSSTLSLWFLQTFFLSSVLLAPPVSLSHTALNAIRHSFLRVSFATLSLSHSSFVCSLLFLCSPRVISAQHLFPALWAASVAKAAASSVRR